MSIRSDIINAIKSKLEAATVANGYLRTVATVEKLLRSPGDSQISPADYDWIGVVPARESFVDRPNRVRSTWAIELYAYLEPASSDADAVSDAVSDHAKDVRKALYEAPGNLGVAGVESVRLVERITSEGDPQLAQSGKAISKIVIHVIFEEEFSA